MKSKILATVLAAMLLLALTACGEKLDKALSEQGAIRFDASRFLLSGEAGLTPPLRAPWTMQWRAAGIFLYQNLLKSLKSFL